MQNLTSNCQNYFLNCKWIVFLTPTYFVKNQVDNIDQNGYTVVYKINCRTDRNGG